MQFHGNSLPKTLQERRRNITIKADLSTKMSGRLASHEGSGTELILKCILIDAFIMKTIDRVLTIQNH